MKKSELFFSVLLVPLDYVLVVLAGLTAYALRFTTFADVIPVAYALSMSRLLEVLLPAGIAWLVVFAGLGLYQIRNNIRGRSEIPRIFFGSTAAVAFFIFVIFFSQELFASRFIVLMTWALSVVYLSIGRLTIRWIQRTLLRKGVGARNLVLVTPPDDSRQLARVFRERTDFGYNLISHQTAWDESTHKLLHALHQRSQIDDIIFAFPHAPASFINEIAHFCEEEHITFHYTADVLPIPLMQFTIAAVAGVPIITLQKTRLDGWGKIWKRMFDIIFASLLLVVVCPLLLVVAIAVRLDSEGPIIKKLTRVGERGKPFMLFKFRSMISNAEQLKQELLKFNERKDGPLFKMKNDPRITRVGKFIRKTSLDELPQLLNVLQGNMSLVGPRPHEPQEVAQYTHQQKKLLTIKPGMTGMAQISGRSDLAFGQEAQLDIYYIENWSLLLDVRILVMTPAAVLARKGSI